MLERTDRVNFSTLKHIRQSPRHYRHALDNPREDTEALLLGRAFHCAVYEPEEVANRYVVMPKFHGSMKEDTAISRGYAGGRAAKARWIADAGSRTIVPLDIWDRARGMADAVINDPIAGPLVALSGDDVIAEFPIKWTDEETGIECRGRVDHVNGSLSDLKSTRNIEPRKFFADVARYSYHAQLAYYSDGLTANGVQQERPPSIVAVESSAPYDVVVITLSEADLAAGRAVYRECLATLIECREADLWPGTAGGAVVPLTLPAWAMPAGENVMAGWEA